MLITTGRTVSISLTLVLMTSILCQINVYPQNEMLSDGTEQRQTESNTTSDDAWLSLSLISWQGNTSTTWDTDGTDMDVQFQICIDLDGESDGISPQCTWTEVWNNTLNLSNAWETTFDLVEDNTTLNITIECWDNDDDSDEWNNGPDACDMNPDDDEWRLYYEVNWSTTTTDTFSGDGSLGNDTQWGNAESTWKVEVIRYPDSDADGIADQFDECNQTPPNRKIASNGCWWLEGDIDGDGIINPEDGCHGLPGSCSLGPQYIIEGEILDDYSWFHPNGEIVQSSGILAPNGSFSLSWRVDTTSKGTHNSYLHAAPLTTEGLAEEILLEKFMGLRMVYGKFVQDSFLVIVGDGTISEIQLASFHDVLDGAANNLQKNDLTVFDGYHGCAYLSVNPSQTRVVIPCRDSGGLDRALLYDAELGTISDLSISVPRSQDDTEWLSDRHFLMDEIVLDVLTGTTQDLTQNPEYVSKGWASGYTNFPGLIYEMGNGEYTFANPITGDLIFSLKGCPHSSCYAPDHYLKISPNGERILIGNDGNSRSQSVGYLDSDLDMVPDYRDACNNTPFNLEVNPNGCSNQETDSDADGIRDTSDDCPNTVQNAIVNGDGCAQYQLDDDLDGVANDIDECAGTPAGESISIFGCSTSQVDTDEDGIYDSQDNCPSTPRETTVDSAGCAPNDVVDLDSDGDGVRDSVDVCPNSATGIIVDSEGCKVEVNTNDSATNEVSDGDGWVVGCIGILFLIGIITTMHTIYGISEQQDKPSTIRVSPYNPTNHSAIRTESQRSVEQQQHAMWELENQRLQAEQEVAQLQRQLQQSNQMSAAQLASVQSQLSDIQQQVTATNMAKADMERELEQMKAREVERNTLTESPVNIQDSAVAGDSLIGSTKIENQTVNDADAIARAAAAAAIDAYRMGLDDRER